MLYNRAGQDINSSKMLGLTALGGAMGFVFSLNEGSSDLSSVQVGLKTLGRSP
jgi:hypothetical protein